MAPKISWSILGNEIRITYSSTGMVIKGYDQSTQKSWPMLKNIDIKTVFDRCIWKGVNGNIHSRLFCDAAQKNATFVGVDIIAKKIHVLQWKDDFPKEQFRTKNPVLQVNLDDSNPQIEWQDLPQERAAAIDPVLDEEVIRDYQYGQRALLTIGAVVALATTGKVAYYGTCRAIAALAEYVIAPAATLVVETVGFSGLGVLGIGVAAFAADVYWPEQRIVPKIKETVDKLSAKAKERLAHH